MMIRRSPLFLLVLLAAGCGSPDPATKDASSVTSDDWSLEGRKAEADLGGLDVLVADWVEMWNSYDLDQVGDLFLNDDRLTYFSSEKEGLIRGMDAVQEHHRGFGFVSGGEKRPSRLWMEEVKIDPMGDAAVVTGIWFFQSDPESGTEPQRGPVTIVCLRTDAGWRFGHMNFSSYPEQEAPPPAPA